MKRKVSDFLFVKIGTFVLKLKIKVATLHKKVKKFKKLIEAKKPNGRQNQNDRQA
jgi:uncharacterized membrane protein YciS (DUF1049 family)